MAVVTVGAAARAGVAQVILHEHARDHRAALRRAQHCVVLARVQVRLRKYTHTFNFELKFVDITSVYNFVCHLQRFHLFCLLNLM